MMYEISFNGPGAAFRTLNANRFVKVFAGKLHHLFADYSAELVCHLHAYRDRSYEYLVVQWRDASGGLFDYTFRATSCATAYNTDSEGYYQIESGDTMNVADLCEALAHIDLINQTIVELHHQEGSIPLQLKLTAYSGGEEPVPI